MYNCINRSHWNIPFEREKTINCLNILSTRCGVAQGRRGAVGCTSDSQCRGRGFEPHQSFLEQETLPLLLITGWFVQRIRAWYHIRTKIKWGPYGRLNIVKTKMLLLWESNHILCLFHNVYILDHFGEQGSMISAIKLRRDHVLLPHNATIQYRHKILFNKWMCLSTSVLYL